MRLLSVQIMVKPHDNEILKYSFGDWQFFKQMISHSSRCSNRGEWYMWCLVYSWIETMQEKTEEGWCESLEYTPTLFCLFLYCLYPTVQKERKRSKEYLVIIILAVKRKFRTTFLPRVHLWKQANTMKPA